MPSRPRPSILVPLLLFGLLGPGCFGPILTAAEPAKPRLLYYQYYQAPGENRYPADGNFRPVLAALGEDFEVVVDRRPPTAAALGGVQVLLIVNPNDQAVAGHPAPPHVTAADAAALYNWVLDGGGVILMGNQENHNLETADMNRLLGLFGLRWVDRYTDAKRLVLPPETPLLGGLTWGYYTGNLVEVMAGHPARPACLVANDLAQAPARGSRDEPGCLLAVARPGRGRVAVVTDSGWIADWALNEAGVGGVVLQGQDNLEIMRRLARWAAGREPSEP